MEKAEPARDRILAAAFDLFSDKGFMVTSTKEIANRANVAEITLFRHFANKEILFDTVAPLFFNVSEIEDLLPLVLDKPLVEGLEFLAARFISKLSGVQNWHRVYRYSLLRNSEVFPKLCEAYMEGTFTVCCSYLNRAKQRGEVNCDDTAAVARAFIMTCNGYHPTIEVLERGNCQDDESMKKFICQMVRLFVTGVNRNPAQSFS